MVEPTWFAVVKASVFVAGAVLRVELGKQPAVTLFGPTGHRTLNLSFGELKALVLRREILPISAPEAALLQPSLRDSEALDAR